MINKPLKADKIPEQQWRYIADFNQYWIASGNQKLFNDELVINLSQLQQIELSFDQPNAITRTQLPDLLLGWHDVNIAFLAQGQGPFSLFVGDSLVQTMENEPAVVKPPLRNLLNSATEFVMLAPKTKIMTHSNTASKDIEVNLPPGKQANWTTYLLWLLILIVIASLILMVSRLMVSMSQSDDDTNKPN